MSRTIYSIKVGMHEVQYKISNILNNNIQTKIKNDFWIIVRRNIKNNLRDIIEHNIKNRPISISIQEGVFKIIKGSL